MHSTEKEGSRNQPSRVVGLPALHGDREDEGYITGVRLFIVISVVTLACFIALLDASIVVTAVPQITSDFHSLQDVGWYGSSYLLAICVLQPMTGKLYEQFNSKYVFLCFLAIFELGSLLCGLSNSSKMLIIGRAIAGLGCSGIFNGSLTIIAASVPLEKRSSNVGVMLAFTQVTILAGPLIGGSLTQYTTWRWCFYLNLPAGALVACFFFITSIPQQNFTASTKDGSRFVLGSLDPLGFVLFAPAAAMFLLAIEWGGSSYSWNSAIIIGLCCGAGVAFIIFLAWEHSRGDAAMIPLRMLRKRVVWSSCLAQIFFSSGMYIVSYYIPIYFQAIKNASPTLSGVYMLPGIISTMIFTVISGILVSRLRYYLPWIIASGILQAIGAGLLSTLTPNSSPGMWIGYQIIAGVGRGCGVQIPIIAVQTNLKPQETAIGMALIVFCQNLGGTLFLSFAQTIFSNSLVNALHKFAAEINVSLITSSGATGFRDVIPESSVARVLLAYNEAVNDVFYLASGGAVAMFLCCWGMGWKSVNKVQSPPLET